MDTYFLRRHSGKTTFPTIKANFTFLRSPFPKSRPVIPWIFWIERAAVVPENHQGIPRRATGLYLNLQKPAGYGMFTSISGQFSALFGKPW